MVERDVNPLGGRQRSLSARFKAAWAFHQLLGGMHRTQILEHFDDGSEAFKSAFETLKRASEQLAGPATSDSSVVPALLDDLESQVQELESGLSRTDEAISPSQVRRFFQQVRSFDERILIDIIRFYQRVEGTGAWEKDRLDKVDLVVSRLAESIAGPELQGDRTRLRKVLQALAGADSQAVTEEAEITSLSETLRDLRSEVRWAKTFDELHESKLVQLYRALKHDMGYKLFHPNLLPLVADVNNAFKLKVDELRGLEEDRIVSEYRRLLQAPEKKIAGGPELEVAMAGLQRLVDEFEARVKTENVRLDELAILGKSLRDVSRRFQDRLNTSAAIDAPRQTSAGPAAPVPRTHATEALLPNLDAVQPFWDELMAALAGLDPELDPVDASTQGAVLKYRLEAREVAAFRALGGEAHSGPGVDHFVLAAVALRRRISSTVDDIQGALSEAPGTKPESVLEEARWTSRMADAYMNHFSHLVDQAVFEGDLDAARSFQLLKMRFMREYSGLLNLIPRLSTQTSLSAAGFPVESEDLNALATGSFQKQPADEDGE
jgi:hypothetical protein